jgi:hypothetical protein
MGGGDRKSIVLLEGSQALPACPADKGQCGSEDIGMVRSSGLRRGPRDFGFRN